MSGEVVFGLWKWVWFVICWHFSSWLLSYLRALHKQSLCGTRRHLEELRNALARRKKNMLLYTCTWKELFIKKRYKLLCKDQGSCWFCAYKIDHLMVMTLVKTQSTKSDQALGSWYCERDISKSMHTEWQKCKEYQGIIRLFSPDTDILELPCGYAKEALLGLIIYQLW